MTYNYLDAMKDDIKNYIDENVNQKDWIENRDGLENHLNEELWTEDSVTGNASGSYTFNSYAAKEYVMDNTDLLADALTEYGSREEAADILLDGEWESADITIRCYLLGQAISEVLDEYEEDGYFDSTEE